MKEIITLRVNGEDYTVLVEPRDSLLDVLREKLGLTGTKRGCDLGGCGACTVLINGESVPSCLQLAIECQGKEITTIEGINVGANGCSPLHPLQESFIHHGAIQCGFCTPGMVLSAYALITRNPEPTEPEIKEALSGNLCRCTGYTRIVEAVKNWGNPKNDRRPRTADRGQHQVVGKSMPRVDAWDKVTGRAKYIDDIKFPNMLYGKILRGPIAHGIIKKIDTSEAAKLPGVKAIITGSDVPDRMYGVSPARYDEYVLAKDKVRYVGDEVAAVAAIDEATAVKACELIKVEYEQLPAVFAPFTAMKPGAPQLHERYKNNINTEIHHHFGNVNKGFEEADIIIEDTFVGNHTHQAMMEPHGAIAHWQGADSSSDGTLVVYSSTQVPHYVHYMLANVFDIQLGRIRVVTPSVGGGFGGKAETTPLDLCSAILSKKTGRPVKMVYTREEQFYHGRGRHKQYMKFKLGVKRDGTITAVKSEIYLDGGAYTSFGIITAYYAGSLVPTLYKIPNYQYDGYRVVTNKPACGAMRGHGVPQPRFAFECLLTMAAEKLGIDPIEIRLKNAMTPNTMTCNDLCIRSCEFKSTLKSVADKAGWKDKYGKLPPGKGIGIGCGGFVSGAGYAIYRGDVRRASEKKREEFQKRAIFPHANAVVRVTEDGTSAILMIDATDIGQGSDTVLSQICADALGIPLDRVRLKATDTDISPLDLGAYSSRVTLMGGNACMRAAIDVRKKLLPIAAKLLQASEAELDVRDGKIFVTKNHGRSVDWAECARMYFNEHGPLVGTGWYKPPEGLGGDYKGAAIGTSPAYSFSSAVCELSVDLETGRVNIEKFTDYHDCGTPINPLAVHGQVEGAIVMGAGETLMEEVVFNEKGEIVNPTLNDYLLMTIKDAPEIFSGIVDSYEPEGPYGAKEVGEGATLPVLAAVAHAIKEATGCWIKELPITPEKILKELHSAGFKPAPTQRKEKE